MSNVNIEILHALKRIGARDSDAEIIAAEISKVNPSFLATKTDIIECRADLKADISECRNELKAEISECRADLKVEISKCRNELKADISECRADIKLLKWMITFVLASGAATFFILLKILAKISM